MTNYVTFVVGEILLLILTICSMAAIFPRVRGIVYWAWKLLEESALPTKLHTKGDMLPDKF